MVLAVWYHLSNQILLPKGYLQDAVYFWGIDFLFQIANLYGLSIGRGGGVVGIFLRPSSVAEIERLPDATLVTVTLSSHIEVYPGQFLYLLIPKLGLHTHPFSIISRSKETVTMLVEKRGSFTKRLFDRTAAPWENQQTPVVVTAYIEGPYGIQDRFNSYKTIVFSSHGVSITRHLMTLEKLLRESRRTIRIHLHWYVEKLGIFIPTHNISGRHANLETEYITWLEKWANANLANPGIDQVSLSLKWGGSSILTSIDSQYCGVLSTSNRRVTANRSYGQNISR